MVDADGVRATDRLIPMAESYFAVEENHFLEEPKFSGSDDYEWLQRLLQEESMVTTEASGPLGDSDDVVLVKQVKAKSMNSDKVDANDDDCVILDGDPNKVVSVDDGGSDDLHIVGEKGQIACRDYPHSRHLCLIFLFRSTSHANYCTQCHCYVCDSPAPCSNWGTGTLSTDHCHATDKEETWKTKRKMIKQKKSKPDVPHLPLPIRPDIQLPPWQPPAVTSFTAPDSNYQPAPYPRGNTVDSATIVLQNQTRGINHGNLRNYYSPKSPVFKKTATLSRSLTVPRNSNRITTHNVLRSMRGYNAVSDQAIVRRPNLGHHQSTAPPDKRSRNCIQPTNQHFQVMNLHKSPNQQTLVGNYWSSQSDPQAVRGGNNGFEDKFVGITVADIKNWLLED